MRIGEIQFPEPFMTAVRDGTLVVFAGAGVSMGDPANLPSFARLAQLIAEGTGQNREDREPEDRFLGRLKDAQVEVHKRAAKLLSREGLSHTPLHRNLLRLYKSGEEVRLVTTNFDLLFEDAAKTLFAESPETFRAPALPSGERFRGIVHIHGAVNDPYEMVLTDSDFGRGYLTEGWANRFLVDLFRQWIVLFIGYRHNDVIVNYLARALPRNGPARFALTPETEDLGRWRIFGIEPVIYPQAEENSHTSLHQGMERFASTLQRSILDWQREITDLASKTPPMDVESQDIIEHALEDVPKTRFFTGAATAVEWIDWLDDRGHLKALFQEGILAERDRLLAHWLAERFMTEHSDKLFLLLAKHRLQLNTTLWEVFAHPSSYSEERKPDAATMSRWVSLLLATRPPGAGLYLMWLGHGCIKHNDLQSLLDIFDTMTEGMLKLESVFPSLWGEENEAQDKVDVDVEPRTEHTAIREIWQKGLRPHLEKIAEPLLVQATRRLESYHRIFEAWQKAGRTWDRITWRRSAIEPHDQDKYPEAPDVLIDAARDCVEWLAGNNALLAHHWIESFANSEAPIVRRLAIHVTRMRNDFSGDQKIEWLLVHGGLHEIEAHHETFQLVASAYPGADPTSRKKVIDAVLEYRWPYEDEPDRDEHTERHHFDWLHWIHTKAPDCELAKNALDQVGAKHSDWGPTEHPDLTSWVTGGWGEHKCPWTVEGLLEKPPAEWLSELLTYEPEDSHGSGRWNLHRVLGEAVKAYPAWGFGLADALIETSNWESDLWVTLLQVWLEKPIYAVETEQLLNYLDKTELYPAYAREIALLLRAMIEQADDKQLLPRANAIASSLWKSIDRKETIENVNEWAHLAIARPAGILAEFWLVSFSLWRQKQEPASKGFNKQYQEIFSMIAEDQSLAGRLGCTILASELTFLFTADEAWTRSNLLPLFNCENDPIEFQGAWQGFLARGQLNLAVVQAMEPMFLKAVAYLEKDFVQQKDRFAHCYTYAFGFFIEDPCEKWIPLLLTKGGEDAGDLVTRHIGYLLDDIDDSRQREWWQRWLRKYWENRLEGAPLVFTPTEIKHMLDWLPHLHTLFPEAVDLAVQMPKSPVQHSFIVHQLERTDLPEQYPESIVQLMEYLESIGSRSIWYGAKKLSDKVLAMDLEPSLEKRLRELIAKLGLE